MTPTQLTFSDVTSNSVTLHWVSGYDMGYPQWFFFFKWNGTSLIRVSISRNKHLPVTNEYMLGKTYIRINA